jgi:long-chain acyl-CoA synthetase
MGQTLGDLWRAATAEQREFPAYLVQRDGDWAPVSWSEAAARVDRLASRLLALGVRRGDRFAILGRTTLDWGLLDWALLSIGAVVVPIYPTSSESECAYILENAEAVGLAVDDELDGLGSALDRLPAVRHVFSFAELTDSASSDAPESSAAEGSEDDVATIIYTSGTTGPPKGCLLTHRNYVRVATRLAETPGFLQRGDRTVLFLPLAHTFGRLVVFAGARIGFTIAFCPDVNDLPRALEQVRPDFLPSVPRLYEKTEGAVKKQLGEAQGAKRRLARWALDVGYRSSALAREGSRLPAGLALQRRFADRLVFSKVRAKLGGRLRFGISGAAPLGTPTLEFFHALRIPVLEAYGLTECLPVAVNLPDRFRLGTVGKPFEGSEVRIAEDGEILARGEPLFGGYFGDAEATRAAIDGDGWFHTGDIGHLDEDGFLTITDRKKDLIATAGGKKISPQNIEQLLQQGSSLVSHALIVGDRRPYITALITLGEDELAAWAAERGLGGTHADLAETSEVRALLDGVVEAANRELARPAQVKRFAILPRDLSIDEGEITPTLKVRRAICMQHFEAQIEALYDGTPG